MQLSAQMYCIVTELQAKKHRYTTINTDCHTNNLKLKIKKGDAYDERTFDFVVRPEEALYCVLDGVNMKNILKDFRKIVANDYDVKFENVDK